MAMLRPLIFAGLILLTGAATVVGDELACNQDPRDRFYWVERAFCDIEMVGPQRAHGVIIWNHGIFGTTESWKAPAPPVLRVAQVRGWDVIMIKRHHLAETMPGGPLDRTVRRTLEEAAARRQAGYKRIVLAGQSFGGYVTMDAIDTSSDIDAAVAFAPGVRPSGGSGALDPSIIERILQRARVGRLAVVFPKDDTLFGSIARGARALPILAKRDLPWLMIDETAEEIRGHGGAVTGRFALRYGHCLSEFLAAPVLAAGRFTCPQDGNEARVVRELLLPRGKQAPNFAVDPARVPPALRGLLGPRWALLGDVVALVGPIEDQGTLKLMYRTGPTGGVWDATIGEGGITAVLRNRATVHVSSEANGTVVWTSEDKSRTLKGVLIRLDDLEQPQPSR